ncbi:MAG: dihydrolipoyl dehydrogenase [Candidatus Bipolaricaulota bacterium]|nr:MAG: dihydrolipoyl dehydrogenase [Candidatus Bipolaricaulota bacterium]
METQVAIVGAGPAGYTAALRLRQLGSEVVLIERDEIGGTCLNWGCIPTKALFHATERIEAALSGAAMGIRFAAPEVNVAELRSWTTDVVTVLRDGVGTLLDGAGVAVVRSTARLATDGGLLLDDGERVKAERIVLASGSAAIEIPSMPFDGETVWSSDDALALTEIPERFLVIGAGVVGLEMALLYRRLGSEVTVVELADRLLPTMDLDPRILSTLGRGLAQRGITVRLGDAAASFAPTGGAGVLTTASGVELEADRMLVAVGRRARTRELGLEELSVACDEAGRVTVDEGFATSVPGLYAIGDVIAGPMLAHKASADALAVAAGLHGESFAVDYEAVPQAVFTDPEVACVGLSERSARERGLTVDVGRFPYAALGRAQAMDESEGLFQVVADHDSGRLLGVQVVGAHAADLIGIGALGLHGELTVHQLADAVQVHPTLPEGLKEAAENALGRAIHIAGRRPRREP